MPIQNEPIMGKLSPVIVRFFNVAIPGRVKAIPMEQKD